MTRSTLPDQVHSDPGTEAAAGDGSRLPAAAPARRWLAEQPSRAVLAAVLAITALAQIRVWATGRGLWGDELAISINLRERAFTELVGELMYYQVAPVGWLVTGKAMLVGIGDDERALRLPSLAAGLLVLALVAVIADRAVGRWAAVAAVGLVGMTPAVLYYAGELKQYSVETAVALGLVVAGAAMTFQRARWLVFVTGGAVALLAVTLSYSALVVLAGVVAGVVTYLVAERDWRAAFASVAALAPAGMLGAGLVLHRRSLPFHPNQDTFFPAGFPDRGGVGAVLAWLPEMWSGLTEDPLGWRSPWLTLPLVAAGFVTLAVRGRWQWAAILGGVLVAALGAAAVRGLPMAGRVGLYLVPLIILLIVAGLAGMVRGIRWLGRRRRPEGRVWPALAAVVVAALVAIAGPPVRDGFAEVRDPTVRDSAREALWTVAELRQPGDVVAVYYFSHKTIRWYGGSAGVRGVDRLRLVPEDSPDCQPERLDELLAGAERLWYLHGARKSSDPADYQDRMARELAGLGRIVETHDYHGSSGGWVLVDLTAGPDTSPPTVAPDPRFACLTAD